MSGKPLVAANWKLNGSRALCEEFGESFEPPSNANVWFFPPASHISFLNSVFRGSDILVGAQNVWTEDAGAFTGEISARMVRDVGGGAVLVGHSERRTLFGETDAVIAKKFKAVEQFDLMPVLCVGETLEQREAGHAEATVQQQLQSVLGNYKATLKADGVVVAYEPVWAIGTGKSATPDQVRDMHKYIGDVLDDCGGHELIDITILYGGSVKATNARELFSMEHVDGFLVGSASLDVADFNSICKAVDC